MKYLFENNSHAFTFEPKTPIYTGENIIDRQPKWISSELNEEDNMRLLETGIMGSLRYWFSVFMKYKTGYECCDYTGGENNKCLYDPDKGKDELCPVCRLFGCTGYAKPFKIIVSTDPEKLSSQTVTVKSEESKIHDARHNGWRIYDNLFKSLKIEFVISRNNDREFVEHAIISLLVFIQNYAGIGPKSSQGCGIILLKDEKIKTMLTPQFFSDWNAMLKKNFGEPEINKAGEVFISRKFNFIVPDPNIKQSNEFKINGFTFNKSYSLSEETKFLPVAPVFRSFLRNEFRPLFNGTQKIDGKENKLYHYYLGKIVGNQIKLASVINISHLYRMGQNKFQLRIYGVFRKTDAEVINYISKTPENTDPLYKLINEKIQPLLGKYFKANIEALN